MYGTDALDLHQIDMDLNIQNDTLSCLKSSPKNLCARIVRDQQWSDTFVGQYTFFFSQKSWE